MPSINPIKPNLKSILKSKKFDKPEFTQDEKAVIIRAQQQVLDKMLKQEIDTFAKNTVKPWVDGFALFEKIKKANKGKSGVDQLQASDIISSLRPADKTGSCNVPLDAQLRDNSPGVFSDYDAEGCTGVFIIEPPYDDGDPLVEVRVPNELPTNSFDCSSSLVVPTEGVISLGVAAGQFPIDEVYPAPYEWFFGKYNRVEGSLIHTVILPSPLLYATQVTVTADFKLGVDWPYEQGKYALSPALLGESLGDGLVMLLGNSLVTLHGDPAMNSGNAKYTNFLKQWKSRNMSCYDSGECKNLGSFSTTASLILLPGASSFTLIISAVLKALLTQVPGGTLTGFAGADFLSPGLSGLWLLSGARGGAIRVPKIRMSFCRVGSSVQLPGGPLL